jgi:hypothetical protein
MKTAHRSFYRHCPSRGIDNPASAQDGKDTRSNNMRAKTSCARRRQRDVACVPARIYARKSGSTKFNIDVLHKQSDDFIERCLANPDEKAMEAMTKSLAKRLARDPHVT